MNGALREIMNTKIEPFLAKNPNPILCVGKDGTVCYSNEAGEPLLHEWNVKIGGKLPSNIGDFVKRVISQSIPSKMEVNVGKRVYLATFYPTPENESVNIYGFDISDQKTLEEKLRESEEKYRNIVETANEGLSRIDSEAKIIYINTKMVDMLGYTANEMIGKVVCDFVKDVSLFKQKLERRRLGINESYELELIRKDGSSLWVLINAKALFDKDGKFMGSISMLTDITELKKLIAQTRQRAEEMTKIMDVAPVAILIGHDPHSQRITGNRMANELFETEVGKNVSTNIIPLRRFFYKGRELTTDELPMQQASLKNIDVRNVEFEILLPNGKRLSLLGSASPLHDTEGHVRGSVGAFIDITERKEAEEALKYIEIIRKKEIHHRIKNNLQVISSLLDLQTEKFKGRKDINDLEVLEAFKESQDRVISMALIHEELYKGGGIDTLNFSSYVKELTDNLLLTYKLEADVSLNFELEGNLSFDMDTAIPLGIIINELVTNSLKHAFIGRDKGKIQIKLQREESEDFSNTFVLSVSDNGVGIPEDFNIEDLDSLGLQLVTSLVDQLDGDLELKRDIGTEFIIRFIVPERKKSTLQLVDND
jgi:PAS domain S-box-containing protein